MHTPQSKARWLASSLRCGAWTKAALIDRTARLLPRGIVDYERFAARLIARFDTMPGQSALTQYLSWDSLLDPLWVFPGELLKQRVLLDHPVRSPLPGGLSMLVLPDLATSGDVAEWLGCDYQRLAWLADVQGWRGKSSNRVGHHYRYRWLRKRSGAYRLLEVPKALLKEVQRTILRDLFNRVPPHSCAHGFTRGRSIKTYVLPHLDQPVLMRLDLADFFPSIPVARVVATLSTLGYPRNVARQLAALCTNRVSLIHAGPKLRNLPWRSREQLLRRHLPQGAPTSPAIANLCAWRLDCRLHAVAKRFDLSYTRYADDLAFSGSRNLLNRAPFVESLVGAIALEEGFSLNHRKTRIRTRSQRQKLAGIVVNASGNCQRREFDQLRATLHNCRRFGPADQNRNGHRDFRAHLAGRIAHVAWLNPNKGQRLYRIWRKIDWP